MAESFEGSTLALQHYYDILEVSRRFPLMTLYRASEQPFGQRMSVWMASEPFSTPLPDDIRERIESAMLRNRAVQSPHAPRILDFGSGEGHGFVVTQEIPGDSLFNWIRAHGPLSGWQILRLAEQLTDVVTSAHDAGFRYLCLTSSNVFVTDEGRFEVMPAPLGIGLNRSELLRLRDVPITPRLALHIPPWEFATRDAASPLADAGEEVEAEKSLEAAAADGGEAPAERKGSAPEPAPSLTRDRSVTTWDSSDEFDADVYGVAALIYEAMTGGHPYFGNDDDVCDAVFVMMRETPRDAGELCELPSAACGVVMEVLASPVDGVLPSLVARLREHLGAEAAEQALKAEKHYLEAPPIPPARRQGPARRHRAPLPRALLMFCAVVLIVLTAVITYQISSKHRPVDLFSLPELLPPVSEGIDIVFTESGSAQNSELFLVSPTNGELYRLGKLPYIYRNQQPSAQIHFVVVDDHGSARQVPVSTLAVPGTQVVSVD